jgi:hypothetical protein
VPRTQAPTANASMSLSEMTIKFSFDCGYRQDGPRLRRFVRDAGGTARDRTVL